MNELEKISPMKRVTKKHKIIAVAIVVVILVFVGQHFWMKHKASVAAKEAYQQALNDADVNSDTIVVDGKENIQIDKSTLSSALVNSSELISTKYYFTDSDLYKKSKKWFNKVGKIPFTTDETVYTFTGVLSVGVDLSSVDFEIDEENKTIMVSLDAPKYMSAEITDTQSFDTKDSIFNSVKMDDYDNFRNALIKTEKKKVNKNKDFWKQAKVNSENAITGLLKGTGKIDDYKIAYSWREKDK